MKESCDCYKCGGSGFIQAFSGIANGVCFTCKGVGKLSFAKIKKAKKELRENTRIKAEWILASTPSSFNGFNFKRISEARDFCHNYVMEEAAKALYGNRVHEAWSKQGGEAKFQELQEIRRNSLSKYAL